MKADTTSSVKFQYKVEGGGRMLGFQDAPPVFPCVNGWAGTWLTLIGALWDNTWGDAARHQVRARQQVHAITPMPLLLMAWKGMNMTLSSLLLQPAKLNWHKEHATSLWEPQSACKILGQNFRLISQGFSRDRSTDFPFPTLWFIKMA